jgi:RNA polymerase sigma-70 factor (ECF subfamily)
MLPKIYNFFYSRVKEVSSSEDLTQDFFTRIIRKIDRFEWRGEGSFEAWCYQFARNIFMDHLKKQKKHSTVPIESVEFALGDESVEDLKRSDDIKELLSALNKLENNHRELLELKYLQELSIEEICAVVDKSESAVKVGLMRARKKLKEIMETEM